MKKPLICLGLAAILLIGFAVTVNNTSATNSGSLAITELELKNDSSETQISPSEIAFQELNNKVLASIGEGWLYVRENQKHDVDPLPSVDGLIPLTDTITDMWYYINSSGMVERSVTIQRTMDGQISQVGIYSNGTAWNTMVDEIISAEPFLFEGIHYGLPYYLKNPDMKINNILKDGSELTEFTITIAEKEPVDMLDYDKALVSMEHYYVFDKFTGFLVSKKTIANLEDGTQRELDNIQIEIKLGVEPPSDVLKYFDVKKDREGQK